MRFRNYKIICFGGGNAMPKVVLKELKKFPVEITSVTSMIDSGGSTAEVCKEFNCLPPADIKKHLLTLSQAEEWKKELFALRFGKWEFPGGHKGHSFANIFIGGLEKIIGDYKKVLDILHKFLKVKGKCLPAIAKKTSLFAILENGQVIKGEDEIDVPKKHNGELKIKRIFLKPRVQAYPPVLRAIREANLITLGPGDLYSSILPCFLASGIKEAIQRTKAKIVFICPAMTKFGETNDFTVLDFTKEVEKYLGRELDFVIYNTFVLDKKRIRKYKKEHPELLGLVRTNGDLKEPKFIGKNLLLKKGPVEYDSKKVIRIILDLIRER